MSHPEQTPGSRREDQSDYWRANEVSRRRRLRVDGRRPLAVDEAGM